MAQTPSEVLISTLEEFGKCEAKSAVVIFADEAGDIVVNMSGGRATSLGLIELAKELLLRGLRVDS